MASILPFSDAAYQSYNIEIDQEIYEFVYRWNPYSQRWWCLIGPSTEQAVIKFKIVTGLDLLTGYKAYPTVPNGRLILIDMVHSWGIPGRDDIGPGKRFRLVYLQEGETPPDS